jgi:ABC-type dipeptide/oligopeptide/nickel transport system ATPase component
MMEKLLQLEKVSIDDGLGRALIKNASLTIFQGEFIGIVGESGSGKTLTVKSALDLLPDHLVITSGVRQLLGKELNGLSSKDKRRLIGAGIGFVPQNTVVFLHPMIKIKHQMIDAYLYHIDNDKKQALKKASDLLEKVGIKEPKRVLNAYPKQLSGGMQQRVNIAMALMTDPKLIVADEPTTALDTVVQRQVMELFNQLNQSEGVSILFISHDLKIVKQFCQRMYVMYQGEIVESGETHEIFTNPKHSYTQKLLSLIPTLTNLSMDKFG